MTARTFRTIVLVEALVTISTAMHAAPIGTAFTYQGQLKKNGQKINDTCDFQFILSDGPGTGTCPAGGNPVGPVLCFDSQPTVECGVPVGPPITVTDGLFTVQLDFGVNAFDGTARWLGIAVRCPHDAVVPLSHLCPRQELTAAPYSLRTRVVDNPELTDTIEGGDSANPGSLELFNNSGVRSLSLYGSPSCAFCDGGLLGIRDHNGVERANLYTTDNRGGRLDLHDELTGTGTLAMAAQLDVGGSFGSWFSMRTSSNVETINLFGATGDAHFAGNVGIGTAAPQAELDVNGAARTTTLEITGGSPLVPLAVGWGSDYCGEIDVPFDTTIVTGGNNFSLAIRSDRTLAGWGCNVYGETTVPAGEFIAVSAGANHALAIRSDGTLVGWGINNFGQTNVPAGTFADLDAGDSFSVAIRTDGTLVGWGDNNVGQVDVPAGLFTAVTAGSTHSIAIRNDGTLIGWGQNSDDQIDVPPGTFIAVSAGNNFSLAIRSDGTLAGWGANGVGQINVPSGKYVGVAAGSAHGLAIPSDGTLVGWGHNNLGQINVPAGTFSAVAAGQSHSLAILRDPVPPLPALRLLVDSAAKPGSNTWTIWSDRRLKRNIEPLSGALDRLMQLHGVTFQWLDPASQGGITGTQMGLIADEVQRAFPQWVGRDAKGYQTLTVSGFEALAAEALRELRAEKDREITELKEQNRQLEQRLTDLERVLGPSGSSSTQTPP